MKHLLVLLLSVVALNISPVFAEDKKPAPKEEGASIDVNKDGKISMDEAKALAAKQFALYDLNKDGSMSVDEYRKPLDTISKMKKYDSAKKAAENNVIKASFGRMDKDKSGGVSKAEFMSDADLRHKTMDLDNDGSVTPKEIEDLQKKIAEARKKALAEDKKK